MVVPAGRLVVAPRVVVFPVDGGSSCSSKPRAAMAPMARMRKQFPSAQIRNPENMERARSFWAFRPRAAPPLGPTPAGAQYICMKQGRSGAGDEGAAVDCDTVGANIVRESCPGHTTNSRTAGCFTACTQACKAKSSCQGYRQCGMCCFPSATASGAPFGMLMQGSGAAEHHSSMGCVAVRHPSLLQKAGQDLH